MKCKLPFQIEMEMNMKMKSNCRFNKKFWVLKAMINIQGYSLSA